VTPGDPELETKVETESLDPKTHGSLAHRRLPSSWQSTTVHEP
jgi:hypothetical protein